MSTSALQAASLVARRARDPLMTATTKANIYLLLSRMQSLANGAVGREMNDGVIQSATMTIEPQKQAYGIAANLPNALRVVDIRDADSRSLDGPIPFESLKYLNINWWREQGSELRSWAQLGKDLLIIRPALNVQSTVTVFYNPVFANLAVDGDLFTIPDEDLDLVLDPVEYLLDLKAREYDKLAPILERWKLNLKETSRVVR